MGIPKRTRNSEDKMKLEVGMYVRTKKGRIAKIIEKFDNSGSLHSKILYIS